MIEESIVNNKKEKRDEEKNPICVFELQFNFANVAEILDMIQPGKPLLNLKHIVIYTKTVQKNDCCGEKVMRACSMRNRKLVLHRCMLPSSNAKL
uniref:Uncharacterized protein n=1 Tax=Glossina brevipalpis TaxID=37001 RepID=A0A1A9WU65_9MUSC